MRKVAVVLFNLGGPDSLDAVEPFLFNLFNDPAIIGLPGLLRWLVARLISRRRAPLAREIYGQLGGSSPLLPNTEAQAGALQEELSRRGSVGGSDTRVFISMRYWRPRSDETVREVRAFAPDRIVLLPLYPQYSTTTTASSVRDWQRAAATVGLDGTPTVVCCYPVQQGFVDELAKRVANALREIPAGMRPRILFSAHGLPKKVIASGDPYQWQVERTADAIVSALGDAESGGAGFDWVVSYQSRVGPLEWIKPYTDGEIERAGRDRVPLVVVPIAFVSEHSETLVELDVEYRQLAERSGVPQYVRVPTVGAGERFIAGLADLVEGAAGREGGVASELGGRLCPADLRRCACTSLEAR